MVSNKKSILIALSLLLSTIIFAQKHNNIIQNYLNTNKKSLNVTATDIKDWEVTNEYFSKSTKVTHVYIRQKINGIEIFNGVANFNILNNKVINMGNRLVNNTSEKKLSTSPKINAKKAIEYATQQLNIEWNSTIKKTESNNKNNFIFDKSTISIENIPVKLVYQAMPNNELRLAWDLNIYPTDAKNWWSVRVDAETGKIIDKQNWVSNCIFDNCNHTFHENSTTKTTIEESSQHFIKPQSYMSPPPSTDQYNVFPIPVESPIHGSRSVVVGPSDPIASPFGWHDINGVAGPEYTITRGNNVHAYDDMGQNNAPGSSPDGTASLDFNSPLNLNQVPSGYIDAATTNLFYMSNIMHDVWYKYGFDEASGNFQERNYTNAGAGSDYVYAESQDGGGLNNANFASPPEGTNPRMQMFVWSPSPSNVFSVNTPPSPIALDRFYTNNTAEFGPAVPTTPITADLVLGSDGSGIDPYDCCQPIVNGASLNGKIAVIRRGDCTFVSKVQAAQDEGAVAVIIINNVEGGTVRMAGTLTSINIPSIMLSELEGQPIVDSLVAGATINGTLVDNSGIIYNVDGDFDNGIIAHEYGHGISIRLTGGANNSGCLGNDEQMGEGWSDWFGLMLTMQPGDVSTKARGIGTYVQGQPTNGIGIRPAPYSTDFGLNYFTYGHTNDTSVLSMPHGVGFVWATMLWDLNWAFIDKYGFDPDVYNGTGGNNKLMQLVIDGLKLQPCRPGFVDGRDAILQADQILNGGKNECLIWEVFAKRGLGFSANQGSTLSREDQIEAFDLPASLSTSQNIDLCQGQSYTIGNNTYNTAGTYTDVFVSFNGCDSTVTTNISVTAIDVTVGPSGNTITAFNSNSGVTYQWIDCNNNNSIINGETGQVYTATVTGDYAVIVTENNCSDTSVCSRIEVSVGIDENILDKIIIAPNPTQNVVNIDFGGIPEIEFLRLTDTQGKIIYENDNIIKNKLNIDLQGVTKGIYILHVTHKNETAVYKIIKQ